MNLAIFVNSSLLHLKKYQSFLYTWSHHPTFVHPKLLLHYRGYARGQLISEWIYEVIVYPKIPTKNYRDFCPGSLWEGRAEISVIFGWNFGINDDLINSFWIEPTFNVHYGIPVMVISTSSATCLALVATLQVG